jgi:hypothetical protein
MLGFNSSDSADCTAAKTNELLSSKPVNVNIRFTKPSPVATRLIFMHFSDRENNREFP